MVFDIGPFQLYRTPKTGTLNVSIRCLDKYPIGWEYGWEDSMRGEAKPIIQFRIGKLSVFYFNKWKGGFELWVLGFWMMPHWGKYWWQK